MSEKKSWFSRLRGGRTAEAEKAKESPEPRPEAPTEAAPQSIPALEDAPETVPQPEPRPEATPEPTPELTSEPIPEPPPEPAAEPPEPAPPPPADEPAPRKSWFGRLREGLGKSTAKLAGGITGLFTRKKLDQQTLDELEEVLIAADLGVSTAATLIENLRRERFGKEVGEEEVRAQFAADIARILAPVARPLEIDATRRPHVVLVVGVNGSGKTTTIGKLANQLRQQGKRVVLAAGDTFRAAAVEQLRIWGERNQVPVIAGAQGADPAGLAYEALEKARADGADVLLIDTAGRLQNKAGLMQELAKIVRVLRKLDDSAPHSCLLVLDATVGQNAHQQVEVFKEMTAVNGLVVTKLDGSARGGVLVALAERFGLPVVAIGVGEGIDDLRPFDADQFARSLLGLEAR